MSKEEQVKDFLRKYGLARPEDLQEHGISPSYLAKLAERGVLKRIVRGVYADPDHVPTEHHDLAIVQMRVPHAVFCLRTALRFHELTTQSPSSVEIAIPRGRRKPSLEWPPIDVIRVSESQFDAGIETHELREGPTIRVYSPARTVADCFKFRSRLGLDVALETLEACLDDDLCTVEDLTHFAEICRVKNVIRPYLQALA